MEITLHGKVEGHELTKNLFASFDWQGVYEEEPQTYDCPGGWSWECHEVTNAKVYDNWECTKGRDATNNQIEEMTTHVTDWKPQEAFDRSDND